MPGPDYGHAHRKERQRWAIIIANQGALCVRCNRPITGPWDLDHDDHDPTQWLGPAHQHCNRGAGGRKARARERARITRRRSRDW